MKGKTKLGNRYVIIQEAPGEFHLTIQKENEAIYDYIIEVTSKEDLENRIHKLELELYLPLIPETTN